MFCEALRGGELLHNLLTSFLKNLNAIMISCGSSLLSIGDQCLNIGSNPGFVAGIGLESLE